MDQRIVQFIGALRAMGVRVSLAESADAFQAVELLGVLEREAFRTSLRATLIKEQQDIPTFEKLFPMYFLPDPPPLMQNGTQGLTEEEAGMLARALRQFNTRLRQLMDKLLNGQPLSPQELNELDRMVNIDQVTNPRYQNWAARQMEQALQFKEVRKALENLLKTLQDMGMDRGKVEELRQAIQANRDAIQQQLKQHAGEQIMNNLAEQNPRQPREGLLDRPFQAYSDSDMYHLRREVRRLAAALRTRLALRFKRAHTGRLDLKSTLRANLQHGSLPIELRYRDRTLKPKLVVICDISTSMRYCSELMLGLLYAIQDQISKTHAFTFIGRLEYVSPYFDHHPPEQAIDQVLRSMPPGHYNTDLGFALENFVQNHLDRVDHRTTVIYLGDGRNNYNDPRLDLFQRLARRARSTVWLNPEPAGLWGIGDSDMHRYAPLCGHTFQVGNLRQLAAAIDQLLLGPR